LALRSTAETGEQVKATTGPRWEVGPGLAREGAGTTVARLGASDPTKGDTVKGRRVGLAAVIRRAKKGRLAPDSCPSCRTSLTAPQRNSAFT